MSALDEDIAPTGWRRKLSLAFIYLWLAVQIGGPLLQKFELPSLRYRDNNFAWAMYSRLASRLEVTLYRTQSEGTTREPIPDIEHYVSGYRSPAPMQIRVVRRSESEELERLAALVRFVARKQGGDYTYVAAGRWTKKYDSALPEGWEFRAVGRD